MARDILGEYGPDKSSASHSPGSSGLTHGGGKPNVRSPNYHSPQGPINNTRGPGIGDVEPRHGMAGERLGEPGEREFTGSPGIHGTNHGNCGSQGQH